MGFTPKEVHVIFITDFFRAVADLYRPDVR